MTDDRILLKYEFEKNGKRFVNTLKVVDNVEFVQIWLSNGERNTSYRMNKEQVEKLKIFLENVEIRC